MERRRVRVANLDVGILRMTGAPRDPDPDPDPDTVDGVGLAGWARIRGFDVEALAAEIPNWHSRRRGVRHAILSRDPPVAPTFDVATRNLVLDNYLEILARGVSPGLTHLALGDGTTAPDPANNSLNNERYRTRVGQDEQSGLDRITSTFVSQNEANGEAIREIGFTTGPRDGNWTQLTHLVLDEGDQIDEKNSSTAVTIDYIIEFRRI